MINVRGTLRGGSGEVNINMGPLVDMVFLLLIFFVVTTSFVKESGIDVQRSTAATAEVKERGNILLGVSAEGHIYLEGKRIDVRSVRAHVERALAEDPESGVVIVADRNSVTGVVVQAMDQCRLAGAANVSLAARQEGAEGAGAE
jgi:biopolymer transport protein ExbD